MIILSVSFRQEKYLSVGLFMLRLTGIPVNTRRCWRDTSAGVAAAAAAAAAVAGLNGRMRPCITLSVPARRRCPQLPSSPGRRGSVAAKPPALLPPPPPPPPPPPAPTPPNVPPPLASLWLRQRQRGLELHSRQVCTRVQRTHSAAGHVSCRAWSEYERAHVSLCQSRSVCARAARMRVYEHET
jgi:hypothetical protein